jgi:DHA3 family tetracycline resistance protein-like MFS transporter
MMPAPILQEEPHPVSGPRARKVYYGLSAAITLAGAVMYTVLSFYYVTRVGMNPLQLVLVGTVLEGTILIFELPTGVVADTFSRRLSVWIGMFVLGTAWLIEGSFPLFGMVLLAETIRGVGETFLSGALDAWLADEVGPENVAGVYLRSGQINRGVGIAGALLSAGLASIAINLPILAGGGIYLAMGIVLLFTMPETGFRPRPRAKREHPLRQSIGTLRAGAAVVRASGLLVTLLVINAVGGAASEGWDRLWEAHVLLDIGFPAFGNLQPVMWYSLIRIAGELFSLVTTGVFQKRAELASRETRSSARLLMGLVLGQVGVMLVFALAGNFWVALAAFLLNGAFLALYSPLYLSWLVQQIDPEVRATVLSMTSQTNALGQIAGGPGVGAIGTAFSLRAALVVAGLLTAPIAGLYARVAGRTKNSPALAEEASE